MDAPATLIAAVITGTGLGWLSIPHCFGMCGALHLTVSCIHSEHPVRALTVFNLGRLSGYAILGALAGGAGLLLNKAPHACCAASAGAFRLSLATLIPAVCFLVLGIGTLRRKGVSGSVTPLFNRLLGRVGLFGSGCAACLLPCGVLYAALAAAVGTGGIVTGAVLLFAFCLTVTVVMQLVLLAGHGIHRNLKARIEHLLPYVFLALSVLYFCIFFAKL